MPAPVDQLAPAMLERLLAPTYQNRLRAIGRHLDLHRYRSMHLLEVQGGILVRALHADRQQMELLEFPEDAFPQMLREAIAARESGEHARLTSALLPTGYEDALRAIGYEMDLLVVKMIAIVECPSRLLVSGQRHEETSAGSVFVPFDESLSAADVRATLDAAFQRRARPVAPAASNGNGISALIRDGIDQIRRAT
jgi:hypothetical protein